jgi:hypothetical protein
MTTASVKGWLLVIAGALEQWPAMNHRKRSPTEAVFRLVQRRVPRDLQAKVARALPFLPTDDFAEAASMIRRAAERMR